VSRDTSFYVWNVFLILFILGTLCGTAFVTPVDEFSTRMSIGLTLLLTTVAFKYSISQTLPKVAYLTTLDYYIIGTFTFLASVALENAIAYSIQLESDGYVALGFGVVWLGFNTLTFFWGMWKVYQRRKTIEEILEAGANKTDLGQRDTISVLVS
jgi:hypothetical protein